jgi:hypothetical protein
MRMRIGMLGLAAAVSGQVGCTLFLVPVMAKRQFKAELERAPAIVNPATTGQVDNQEVNTGADGTQYRLLAFSAQAACFDITAQISPRQAQRMSFSLQSLVTPDDKDDAIPTVRSAPVRVLGSQSKMVPVQRTAHDTTRDSTGQVIATTDRQVSSMEEVTETELEVCFPSPGNISAQTNWMVLRSADSSYGAFAAWRLYDPSAAPADAGQAGKAPQGQTVPASVGR